MCKGQCPGTAIDGDWRNRTENCELWKGLFRHLEGVLLEEGRVPLSSSPERRDVEAAFLDLWTTGQNLSISGVRRRMSNGRAPTNFAGRSDLFNAPDQPVAQATMSDARTMGGT
jgi:uncharacterized protein